MRRLAIALALALLPRLAPAQQLACDPGDLELRSVDFTGNSHFRGSELGNAIVTTPSSWARRVLHLPIGARRCLDTLELQRDAVRLRLFYRQHGYHKTTVDTRVAPAGTGAVAVDFHIAERPPVIIDSLTVTGLDSVGNREQLLRLLTPFKGRIFDKVRLRAGVDSVVDRLRNTGYAHAAEPLRSFSVDDATDRATVELSFLPGARAHIRDIAFQIAPSDNGDEPKIDSSTVRRLLSFEKGDLYRQRDLLRTQRDLYQLEAYRHVDVGLSPADTAPSDTSLTVMVRLNEGKMNTVRLGVGWATLDCLRTQGRFTDRDFLGGARRLELTGRLSKLALCRGEVRNDPFSNKINYYGAGTIRLPALFGPRNLPSITLFSERTSEFRTYLREVPIGGVAEITRDLRPRALRAGLPLTLAYRIEYGQTQAEDAVFCQVFNRCTLSDIERLQRKGGLRVASVTLLRDRSDNLLDPSNGSLTRLELRTGSTSIDTGAANRFNRAFAEGSIYRPIGQSSVLAARLQLGTVLQGWSLKGATGFVPPQERLYAGGPNSVRGYNQNLLGPVVYVVNSVDSSRTRPDGSRIYEAVDTTSFRESPTGGNTLIVGNLEWRVRAPVLSNVLQLATFVDAGLVWNRPHENVKLNDMRVTPGMGIRVQSPVGPLRADVAYNRYGSPAGAAYFVGKDIVLRCVSPDNSLSQGLLAGSNACPPSFVPARKNTLFSRLTFHFSIGQAF